MSLVELIIETAHTHADVVSDYLQEKLGALSVTWEAGEGSNDCFAIELNESPTWQQVKLSALFQKEMYGDHFLTELQQIFGSTMILKFCVQAVKDQNWEKAWLKDFKPMRFGARLWVCPTVYAPPDPNGIVVYLNPGLAFGTGTHPSTSLCLEWIDERLQTGQTMMDYGCGSGILALAAIKCGAHKVYAIDHDPQAIDASQANASLNDINNEQLLCYLDTEMKKNYSVDVLIANILQQPLIQLAARFTQLVKPSGYCILAGILSEQVKMIEQHYASFGFQTIDVAYKQEWARLVLQWNN